MDAQLRDAQLRNEMFPLLQDLGGGEPPRRLLILSILLSALIYGHDITPPGMVGLLLVFSAIAYRIKRKTDADGKPLIKWAGMNDDKSMDVFHEWHEHCDM